MPLLTIITSTLNSLQALKLTAKSIFSQGLPLQWIIADGDSEDGTIEYLKTMPNSQVIWFSERDTGIFDAWNKACQYIEGEWVIFMGAGDVFVSTDILKKTGPLLEAAPSGIDFIYGGVAQIHQDSVLHRYGEVDLTNWQCGRPAIPHHQGIFHRARTLTGSEPFDKTYRLGGDTKFLLTTLSASNLFYIPVEVVHMDPFGISSRRSNALLLLREYLRIEREVGYSLPWLNKANFIFRSYVKAILHIIGFPSTWSVERTMRKLHLIK